MQNYKCISENVFNGNDNIIDWVLLDDQEPITDLSAITKVTLDIGGTLIDSTVVGSEVIWWTDQEDILWNGELVTTDVLKFRLGGQSLVPGLYNGCKLRVFEPVSPNGQFWIGDASITVHAAAA